jgi:hypothetical protein
MSIQAIHGHNWTLDFVICSLGFASFAGFIVEATPYFVFFSALFSCILFGIRVWITIRNLVTKPINEQENEA